MNVAVFPVPDTGLIIDTLSPVISHVTSPAVFPMLSVNVPACPCMNVISWAVSPEAAGVIEISPGCVLTFTVILTSAILPFTSITVMGMSRVPSSASTEAVMLTVIFPLLSSAGVTVGVKVSPEIPGGNIGSPETAAFAYVNDTSELSPPRIRLTESEYLSRDIAGITTFTVIIAAEVFPFSSLTDIVTA